jgi:hypothetical protein
MAVDAVADAVVAIDNAESAVAAAAWVPASLWLRFAASSGLAVDGESCQFVGV